MPGWEAAIWRIWLTRIYNDGTPSVVCAPSAVWPSPLHYHSLVDGWQVVNKSYIPHKVVIGARLCGGPCNGSQALILVLMADAKVTELLGEGQLGLAPLSKLSCTSRWSQLMSMSNQATSKRFLVFHLFLIGYQTLSYLSYVWSYSIMLHLYLNI